LPGEGPKINRGAHNAPRKPHPISDPTLAAQIKRGFQDVRANIGKDASQDKIGNTNRTRELTRLIDSAKSQGHMSGVMAAKMKRALARYSKQHRQGLPKIQKTPGPAEQEAGLRTIDDFASGRRRPSSTERASRAPSSSHVFGIGKGALRRQLEETAARMPGEYGWEKMNRAYSEFIAGTPFEQAWRIYFNEGLSRVRHDKRRAYGNVRGVQGYYNWENFHLRMGHAARELGGDAHLEAIGKMVNNTKGTGVKITSFHPKGGVIDITLQETDKRVSDIYHNVAIERMENGRITRVGDPEKYDKRMINEFHGGDASKLEERDRDKHKHGEYNQALELLNALIESSAKAKAIVERRRRPPWQSSGNVEDIAM